MAVQRIVNTPLKKLLSDLYVKETTIAECRGEMDGSYLEEISKL